MKYAWEMGYLRTHAGISLSNQESSPVAWLILKVTTHERIDKTE